jgi:hypothetical protein
MGLWDRLAQQFRMDGHHVKHAVQIANHVAEKLAHFVGRVVPVAQVLHLPFQGEIQRLLGRLVEADGAKNIPMAALVGAVLLVAGQEEVVVSEGSRQFFAGQRFDPAEGNADGFIEEAGGFLLSPCSMRRVSRKSSTIGRL